MAILLSLCVNVCLELLHKGFYGNYATFMQ